MKIFNFILATLITTTFVNAQKNLDEKELYNRYPSDKIKQIEYKLGKREQLIAGPYVNEKGESVMITLSKGKMGALQQLKVIIFNENFTASTEKFIDIPQLKNEKPAMYDHFLKDNTLFLLLNVDIKSKTGSSRTIYAYKLDINTKKTIGSPKKIKELAYDKKGADTSSKLLFSNHKDFMAFAEANLNEENRTTTVTYEVFAIENGEFVKQYEQKDVEKHDEETKISRIRAFQALTNTMILDNGAIIKRFNKYEKLKKEEKDNYLFTLSVIDENGKEDVDVNIDSYNMKDNQDFSFINYEIKSDEDLLYIGGTIEETSGFTKTDVVNKVFFLKYNLETLEKNIDKVYTIDDEFIKEGMSEKAVEKLEKKRKKKESKGKDTDIGFKDLKTIDFVLNPEDGHLNIICEINYTYVTTNTYTDANGVSHTTTTIHYKNFDIIVFNINSETGEMEWKRKILKTQSFTNTNIYNGFIYRINKEGELIFIYNDIAHTYTKGYNINMTILSPDGFTTHYSLIRPEGKRSRVMNVGLSKIINDKIAQIYTVEKRDVEIFKVELP
ncbi:MAG TPA: hypothetical protein DIU39_01425 [Flavobacteriales bacterium]|nr:hypothetical protein [Flavobacteriales bacterium]|tara:strand:- start:68335 stop:69999 length:1665 start_codon:yes stop_codon:yes gene_type:complete